MVAVKEKASQRLSSEQIANMQEEARRIAQERLGATVCGMCPIADMCRVKGTGDCASAGPEVQAVVNGGDYDNSPVSYKKDLLDDSKNIVFAQLRTKKQDAPNDVKKREKRPPQPEQVKRPTQKTIAEKFAEAVVSMLVGPIKNRPAVQAGSSVKKRA